jgi:integrase
MPLRVVRRKDRGGALTIVGTVDGESIRRRASSNSAATAREEAAIIETEIIRRHHLGERRAAHTFAEAVKSYVAAEPRSPSTLARLHRILRALGDMPLSQVDQHAIGCVATAILAPSASPATVRRGVIVPIRAVLNHAAFLGWCKPPRFKSPRQPEGRTKFLLPDEVERLIANSAPHLRPLLLFLVGTGARMSEALELEWRDVDLVGERAIFWRTKNGKRRNALLSARVSMSISTLSKTRENRVFLTATGSPYAASERQYGGQIKTGWSGALKRSGLNPELTPHDLRHTWATWHYAVHKDLLALKEAGGWSSVALVERYAHLMPAGHEHEIRQFLGTAERGSLRIA